MIHPTASLTRRTTARVGRGTKSRTTAIRGHNIITWESKGRRHQHEKPVTLMCALINKHPSPLILDPTCGVGPALEAAKLCGRRAIGIEINEDYCQIAADRLRQGVLFAGGAA
jgi:DNA modification methylase